MKWMMKHLACLLAVCLITACDDWESSDDEGSWDDSVSWVNFSGMYRSASGGVLVSGFDSTPGSDPFEQPIAGEAAAPNDPVATAYGGNLQHVPIVPGTATIFAGGYTLNDDGGGNLTGNGGTSGKIDYQTGAWSIDLNGNVIAANVTASYVYTIGGTEGSVEPGSSPAVYSLHVDQQGNKLTFTDNTSRQFHGSLGGVKTAGGDDTGATSGQVVANFEVWGHGVTMVGSFTGDYTASTTGNAGTLENRVMRGTWIQGNMRGDLVGVAGATTVTVPTTTTTSTTTGTTP